MSEKTNLEKNILVIKSEEISKLGKGFIPTTKEEILKLTERSEYKTRHLMEEDQNYKQFIPYIAVKKNNEIFVYQRSKAGGENRLFDKWTLGVGGHVDSPDNLIEATLREFEEELDYKIQEKDLNFVGLINITETPVDLFHLGIAVVVEVPNDFDFSKGELDKLTNRKFNSKQELDKISKKLEPWSRIFYEEYLKNILKD